MKKSRWIILISLVVLSIAIGIGGKIHMDKQKNKELEQERQIALQAKGMFKDIKEIKVGKKFESGPSTINFYLIIVQKTGNRFNTSLTLGDSDSGDGSEAFNQRGETKENIQVTFSNGKKEMIK